MRDAGDDPVDRAFHADVPEVDAVGEDADAGYEAVEVAVLASGMVEEEEEGCAGVVDEGDEEGRGGDGEDGEEEQALALEGFEVVRPEGAKSGEGYS